MSLSCVWSQEKIFSLSLLNLLPGIQIFFLLNWGGFWLRILPSFPDLFMVWMNNVYGIFLNALLHVWRWTYEFSLLFDTVSYINLFLAVKPRLSLSHKSDMVLIVSHNLLKFCLECIHPCSQWLMILHFSFLVFLSALGWYWSHRMSWEILFIIKFCIRACGISLPLFDRTCQRSALYCSSLCDKFSDSTSY